jgi:hypothetical protein
MKEDFISDRRVEWGIAVSFIACKNLWYIDAMNNISLALLLSPIGRRR